jgi:hypothetical protein
MIERIPKSPSSSTEMLMVMIDSRLESLVRVKPERLSRTV